MDSKEEHGLHKNPELDKVFLLAAFDAFKGSWLKAHAPEFDMETL